MIYRVTTYAWERGFELSIRDADDAEIGRSQSHGRDDAELMVRSWLGITDHPEAATAELVWTWAEGPAPEDED